MAVLLVAAAARLWSLDTIPPGLHYDVAFDGIDARDVLAGHAAIFFPRNNGREPLFIYLLALLIRFGGLHVFTFGFASAAMGMLGVVTTYVLWRRLFGWNVAVMAALLLAVTFWHVSMSRLGFRAIMLLPFQNLMLYFLWRTVHTGQRWFALFGGLALGLSQYTYTSARALPLLAVVCCLCVWGLARAHWPSLAVMGAAAAASFAPLGVYFLRHHDEFLFRARQVALVGPASSQPDGGLIDALARTAGMFFVRGDADPMHNVIGLPVLGRWGAALFAAGLLLAAVRSPRSAACRWALCILGMMLLPTALASGAPNNMRALGAAPAAFLLPALTLDAILKRFGSKPAAYLGLALVAAAPVGWRDIRLYFRTWATSADTYGAMDVSRLHEARFIQSQPAARDYFADSDITGKIVRLFVPETEQDGWQPEQSAAIPVPSRLEGDTLYVGMPGAALNDLAPQWLPGLEAFPMPNNPFGRPDFSAFRWSRAAAARHLAQFTFVRQPMQDFDLAGYFVHPDELGSVTLEALWRPVAASGPYDMYVHLLDITGRQLGGSDRLVWPVKDFARTPEGTAPFKWGYYNEGTPTGDRLLTGHAVAAPAGHYTAEIGLARRDPTNPTIAGPSLGSYRVEIDIDARRP